MSEHASPIAIVGVGAILPDAPDASAFWHNLEQGRYSISDVQPDRWDPDLYFDTDHKAPGRTYSKIGGWVRDWKWAPLEWRLPIPPKVGDGMDDAQKWAIACTHAALTDYGWPDRTIDTERTAVILGNAMGGEKHYQTALRIAFPEMARQLDAAPSFAGLPAEVRAAITAEFQGRMDGLTPEITEDTMPGELGNVIAGRVANLFDLHGPNFTVDAACASAMAAFDAAIAGLAAGEFDVAISGGIDRNMGASTYVKFCKIGALSATGTRPFDAGADGFVMGEGAALFVLKRLADAERDGDRIYAVVRGMGGASDGRGKGITAPNPVGQRLAVERAWRNAGLSPGMCSMVEAHGTSTRVGDVVEISSIADVFTSADIAPGGIALGSVKSNIGHLKAAAGAAGMLKATLALHNKTIPPSLGFQEPNPNIDWDKSPFHVNTELTEWKVPDGQVRCAGVSAFGFGGTNFHAVLEEYVPGRLPGDRSRVVAVGADFSATAVKADADVAKAPLRGALVLGAATEAELGEQLRAVQADAAAGRAPAPEAPTAAALAAPERIAIDYADAAELADKAAKALDAMAHGGAAWKLLQGRGIFRGHGPAGKVAFLYTGQGSQYANMLRTLRDREPAVAATFAEADEVMTPLLGHPLTDVIFVDPASPERMAEAEAELQRTEITQPAVLAVDIALTRLLSEYGVTPDMVMGHSLGEYGALVAAGSLSFPAALEAVSARGHEMASLSIDDAGLMVAVMGPLATAEEIVASIDGNVVLANVNSTTQSVIGGATEAVLAAERACAERGLTTARLPVSHAFHTSIVAPASEPLRRTLERLELRSPVLPIIANVTGDFYPSGPDVVPEMLDLLARQVAAPVQFVDGLRRLSDAGARVFVEVGPKWALRGFVADVLGNGPEGDNIVNLATNHPKAGDIVTFNHALCGLYAAGLGNGRIDAESAAPPAVVETPVEPVIQTPVPPVAQAPAAPVVQTPVVPTVQASDAPVSDRVYLELGHVFADFLDRGRAIYAGAEQLVPAGRDREPDEPVVITGAALGTPGTAHIFDDGNLGRLLDGEQFIDLIPTQIRDEMLGHHITRLVKDENGASFQTIDSPKDVLKLAARGGEFDLSAEFGVDAERVAAYGRNTQLAIGAGIDALRDAGIPLVMRYKTTHIGTYLPERWGLPDELRDDTGVIFASAFPGIEEFAAESHAFATDQTRREERAELQAIQAQLVDVDGTAVALEEIERRLHDLGKLIDDEPYTFDRRFLFHVLSMGHSQFADIIGARGPNTQINSACASTTQAIAIAEDWIRAGRCRRVVVVAADDVTSDELLGWFGSGFLASGAAATDDVVADAALPFDRRRHGMILGMGAAALVVEAADEARQRGLQPICEVLGTETANSAFHGSRLDLDHIGDVMERLVSGAEARTGIDRHAIAPATVFVSHETYTPARGGSASAEIFALRRVFGADADRLVIANTKGFTGHPMAVGLEDVVAVKALETGIVPPVANLREPDPELGPLNLSKGGSYPVDYALRLAAGFGSQISMSLLRRTPAPDGRRRPPDELGYAYRVADPAQFAAWLARISGDAAAELEVVQRRLRLVDHGPASTKPSHTSQAPAAPVDIAAPAVTTPAPPPLAPVTPAPVAAPAVTTPAPPPLAPVTPAPVAAPAAPTAVEPVAPAPVAPAAVAATETSIEAVADFIVALVAETTGYPAEMLAPDLDLEADLGIDTVKQAELFATIREQYSIERDDKLQLRDYPTINHIVDFVRDRTTTTTTTPTDTVAPVAPVAAPAAPTAAAPATVEPVAPAAVAATETSIAAVADFIVALVAETTGYPAEMLAPDLDLEADLGIDTVKQAELFATIREQYSIERDDKLQLRDYPTINHIVDFVRDRTTTTTTTPTPTDTVAPATVEPVAPTAAAPATVEPVAPAPVAPAAVAATETSIAAVADFIVALVAETTGYPAEMLAPDLDLEADLGIDTVKQAELFATIREQYSIERDDKLQLRDYPTINHIVDFVRDRTTTTTPTDTVAPVAPVAAPVAPTAAAPATVEPVAPAAVAATETSIAAVADFIVALVAETTGYPAEMLAPDLDLEADLGIDTVKQAELFATIREQYSIERDDKLQLRDYPTINHIVDFVRDRTTTTTTPTPTDTVAPATVEPVAPTAAAPATVEPVAPVAVAATETSIEAVADFIVALVAETTGYPAEMLAPDLDLEADLGIDTVKQAELFATIREQYSIERDDKLQLRDYPTINHIVDFVRDRTTTTTTTTTPTPTDTVAPATVEPVAPTAAAPTTVDTDTDTDTDSGRALAEVEGFPRRVPVAVLRPALEHCTPTAVALGADSRVIVLADTGGVASVLVERLHELGVETLVVDTAPEANALVELLASWRESGPITGVYWLPALDDEGPHAALDLDGWREGLRVRVKLLAAAMRELYADIAPSGSFLVSATRLGGQHGYGPVGASAPMGGAVTGFTKAYARERPDALVKAVDFGSDDDATAIVECLVAETLRDPSTVEIGHADGQRWSVGLDIQPAVGGGRERSLTPESVFVITGAAGSIVSAITADLAARGGTFHLLDLVAEPDATDPDLERFVTDRDGLKRDLAERIAAAGERATPALVERDLARLERAKAAADAIAAVHRAGGTACWHQVDLTDGDAVDAAMDEVRSSCSRVDVLLHCAGLEISHMLADKPEREYDLVFGVKSDGWFNLMHGLGDLPLGAAVVFSSIAGRFGNGGQTDYSAANDLLCKSVSSLRTTRPETRGIAIDWTAWASIGMASRGSIPKMMALAGIDMLPPEIGVAAVRREITAAGPGREVVVAGNLGALLVERDGLDTGVARSPLDATAGPMLGVFTGWTLADGLAVSTTLDPVEQGFLDHHRIDGTPVLPGVMGIEAFAEVASASASGWTAVAVEDITFLAPCKFFRDEPRTLELEARPCLVGDELVADCRLLARRSLVSQPEQVTTHFTGRVRLARAPAPPRTVDPVGEPSGRAVSAEEIYRIYFHGPAYQVVDVAWRDGDRVVGRLADDLPCNHQPDSAPLAVEPRLIELCFQTAGILELGTTGRLALPLRVGQVLLFPVPDPVGRWRAVVTPRADGRGVDAVVVDDLGHVRIGLEAYETIALPGGVDDGALEPLRQAMQ